MADETARPRVSVIVPTCGRRGLLVGCVRSVLGCGYDDLEVVVVDQEASQALRGVLAREFGGDGRVRYVYQAERALDRARNAGVRAARGEILIFVDDDAEVAAGWAGAYAEAFDGVTPRPGAVGGRLEARWEDGGRPAWWPAGREGMLGVYRAGEQLRPMAGRDLPIGANFATTREAFERVGGFDEEVDYSHDRPAGGMLSGGDSLYCLAVRRAGYALYHQPRAVAWHRISGRKLNRRWLLRRSFWEGVTQVVVLDRSGDPTPWWRVAAGHARLALGRVGRALAGPRAPGAWWEAAAACSQAWGVIYCRLFYLRRLSRRRPT